MIAYALYRWILFPVAYVAVHVLMPILPEKIRTMVRERREPRYTPLPAAPIWIHASSGEIEYAKPVIRALKAKYPELPILVTYFSPSAKKLMQNFPGIDLFMPLPWDRPRELRAFFEQMKPRAGLFARTDVWPTLATEARSRGIPLLLFSATLNRESSRMGFFSRRLSRWTFAQLNRIFCVSNEDAEVFRTLGARLPVTVAGDSRYDQVFARLQEPGKLPAALAPAPGDFVFVMGSTWPQDESVLLPELAFCLQNGVRPILVPHEVNETHLAAIESELRAKGLASVRLSRARAWEKPQILLVDQIGVLAELYRWGRLAFVGGSFKDKVHSVMEPLAAGLPVLVGPHHLNNREALQFQEVHLCPRGPAVSAIHGPAELRERIQFWKSQPDVRDELRALVQQRTGASLAVLNWVEESLHLPNTDLLQKPL